LTTGVGSCTITLTTNGIRTLTATYGGDSGFDGSSTTALHEVGVANEVVTLAAPPSTVYNSNPDAGHPEESVAGTFPINAVFTHSGDAELTDIYFVVTTLRSTDPTVLHYLLNADSPPGQEGATYSLPNGALVGGSWSNGEQLNVTFEIGLMERQRFAFFIDLYATSGAGGNAIAHRSGGAFLDRFEFVFAPDVVDEEGDMRIFLPFVTR